MSRSPAISVVIPTYNRADLVDRCLVSLRAAGIDDLEIVVVDDGGVDDTERVAQAHDAVYIRQANAGPAAARNNGYGVSRGRYVTFLDSDDEWLPGSVERLLTAMDRESDLSVVFGDALMGNPEQGWTSFVRTYGGDAFFALPHTEKSGVRILERRPFFLQLSTRNVMFLGSMLIRREFFQTVGAFDSTLRGAADWDFFMRCAVGGVVAFSDGPAVSRYYKHESGMSTDSDHMEADFIRALDAVRKQPALDDTERRHVEERLRAHVFGWAWLAYEQQNYRVARERLRLSSELGQMGVREATYLALTYLPAPVIGVVRDVRRALGRGGGVGA